MRVLRFLSVGLLMVILVAVVGGEAVAQGPYSPTADTYTDINDTGANHGNDDALFLSASTAGGCVEITYLWFKFDIPSTGTTIASAALSLAFGAGAGSSDLELRSSTDTSWSEMGLTYSNQPALDAGDLATALGVTSVSTATFSGPTLASYLDARQGETVSLVVRADCDGAVPVSLALPLASKEDLLGGSGASLALFDPNAVTLTTFEAVPPFGSRSGPLPVLLLILGLLGSVVAVTCLRRRQGSP